MASQKSFPAGIVLVAALFLISCEDDPDTATPYQNMVVQYFSEIALGFENGTVPKVTRKWKSPMRIWIGGDSQNPVWINALNETISGINNLATDGFQVSLVADSASSNTYIFFGSADQFISIFPDAADDLNSSFGLFDVWWDDQNVIYKARIFVDTQTPTTDEVRSVILEEVTQSLGLGRDSDRYPESIFYETFSDPGFAQSYADMDKELIRLLYHPSMTTGLNRLQAEQTIRKIFNQENP